MSNLTKQVTEATAAVIEAVLLDGGDASVVTADVMLSNFANARLLGVSLCPILKDRPTVVAAMRCVEGVAHVKRILDIICADVDVSVEGEGEFEWTGPARDAYNTRVENDANDRQRRIAHTKAQIEVRDDAIRESVETAEILKQERRAGA